MLYEIFFYALHDGVTTNESLASLIYNRSNMVQLLEESWSNDLFGISKMNGFY